jgi:hypothetical protein
LAYREQDAERARLAEQERQVFTWLETMEAARGQRVRRPRRSLHGWLLILAGPLVGAGVAELIAVVCGGGDGIVPRVIGGAAGFVAAILVALRLAAVRQDGLEP